MRGHGNNFGAGVGQSQQLVLYLRGVGGAAVAKPLSALTRQSNESGVLRPAWHLHLTQTRFPLFITACQWPIVLKNSVRLAEGLTQNIDGGWTRLCCWPDRTNQSGTYA